MELNLLKMAIVSTFDTTFINYHFKNKYEIEEAKKIAYSRTSYLFSFAILIISLVVLILTLALFKVVMGHIMIIVCTFSITLLLYIKNNRIQQHVKNYVDFKLEKYSEAFVRSNKKRGLLNAAYFGIILGMGGYVAIRLLGWLFYHL
ncbi:hypothetical protein [Flavobacterium sp. WC2509]|uniref:hypothetical protein n=1 Tax=Flavobacterium sp. WC2509 TaxID=3461406 RepID=UPI004043A045